MIKNTFPDEAILGSLGTFEVWHLKPLEAEGCIVLGARRGRRVISRKVT